MAERHQKLAGLIWWGSKRYTNQTMCVTAGLWIKQTIQKRATQHFLKFSNIVEKCYIESIKSNPFIVYKSVTADLHNVNNNKHLSYLNPSNEANELS